MNWCKRFCRPLRNHSATWPHRAGSIQAIKDLGNHPRPFPHQISETRIPHHFRNLRARSFSPCAPASRLTGIGRCRRWGRMQRVHSLKADIRARRDRSEKLDSDIQLHHALCLRLPLLQFQFGASPHVQRASTPPSGGKPVPEKAASMSRRSTVTSCCAPST